MAGKKHPEKALVLKFGGSGSTNEQGASAEYFEPLLAEIKDLLILYYAQFCAVIGGGPRTRELQKAAKTNEEKDLVGIRSTQEHATQLVEFISESGLSVAREIAKNDQEAREIFRQNKEFAIALGGLKIGQSTDTVAVGAAEMFQDLGYEAEIIILSNIWRIYTADPKTDSTARPIRRGSVDRLVEEGTFINDPQLFRPGMNVPIDPVAISKLQQQRLATGTQPNLWFGHAQDMNNITRVIRGEIPTDGTTVLGEPIETEYYTD